MQYKCLKTLCLIGLVSTTGCVKTDSKTEAQVETLTATISTSSVNGIGREATVMRRDPSDVIKVGDHYYVWYSKGPQKTGYDATLWYATSLDGLNWQEQGMALAKGEVGNWDAGSVFTPNILVADGRYWLFYTGTSKPYSESPFIPDSKIGIAVSDTPDGPWERLPSNPALTKTEDPTQFDSYLVDDSSLIFKDGKYWLYYKGRQAEKSAKETNMGVAISERPEGPYIRYENNPVIHGTHEVLVWPHGSGVATMVRGAGEPDLSASIAYSDDGLNFERLYDKEGGASSGGGYRPENFSGSTNAKPIEWGVTLHFAGQERNLMHGIGRFEIQWPEDK